MSLEWEQGTVEYATEAATQPHPVLTSGCRLKNKFSILFLAARLRLTLAPPSARYQQAGL